MLATMLHRPWPPATNSPLLLGGTARACTESRRRAHQAGPGPRQLQWPGDSQLEGCLTHGRRMLADPLGLSCYLAVAHPRTTPSEGPRPPPPCAGAAHGSSLLPRRAGFTATSSAGWSTSGALVEDGEEVLASAAAAGSAAEHRSKASGVVRGVVQAGPGAEAEAAGWVGMGAGSVARLRVSLTVPGGAESIAGHRQKTSSGAPPRRLLGTGPWAWTGMSPVAFLRNGKLHTPWGPGKL